MKLLTKELVNSVLPRTITGSGRATNKLYNMPITKSAHKALRQSKRRRVRNMAKTDAYKTVMKEFKKLTVADKKSDAAKLLPKVYKKIDKAAKTGVIKKNKAARLKSSAAKLLN